VHNLRKTGEKINIPLLPGEPMAEHCSFRVGGPAELFAAPRSAGDARKLFVLCREEGIPCFLLGEGANILVSDRGIRGVVMSTGNLRGIRRSGSTVECLAGTPMSEVSERAADWDLAGLETFYSMPGSVGGSIWINARCYEVSLSESLQYVDIVDASGEEIRVAVDEGEFSYKRSPFQSMEALILAGGFRLVPGDGSASRRRMGQLRRDREQKGHFLHPCAGSFFKNNRDFGMPTGKIIDALGLRGLRVGGAMVSEAHANIIVNTGDATADQIWRLAQEVKRRVRDAYGFVLEEEIIRVGDWEAGHGG
jgi:UDP-N-acetylmuramate dehydrogenase